MLCWFLLYSVNQPEAYLCPFPTEPPSPSPVSLLQVITEHQTEFPVSIPTSYLVYTWLYIYLNITSSICPTLSFSTMSTSPFSTSASLFLPCKQVHQYHFSRFHLYVLIYDIFLFLTYFTMYITCSRFIYLSSTDSNLFLL